MTPRPKADRSAKRAEFCSVAQGVFAERGVANTAVSDIVKAAGVAQGTFYLYFDSKDDIVLAVAQQMVDELATRIGAVVAAPGASAVDKLLGLRDTLVSFDGDPTTLALVDLIHRPENRALHDRLTEHLAQRLVVIAEQIVAQGVDEGSFDVPDVRLAAWFVLGGLQSIELAGTPAAAMPRAITTATDLALRALGYTGDRT